MVSPVTGLCAGEERGKRLSRSTRHISLHLIAVAGYNRKADIRACFKTDNPSYKTEGVKVILTMPPVLSIYKLDDLLFMKLNVVYMTSFLL